jgi:hypothetical protein
MLKHVGTKFLRAIIQAMPVYPCLCSVPSHQRRLPGVASSRAQRSLIAVTI